MKGSRAVGDWSFHCVLHSPLCPKCHWIVSCQQAHPDVKTGKGRTNFLPTGLPVLTPASDITYPLPSFPTLILKTDIQCVAQAGLEFSIFLPWPLESCIMGMYFCVRAPSDHPWHLKPHCYPSPSHKPPPTGSATGSTNIICPAFLLLLAPTVFGLGSWSLIRH